MNKETVEGKFDQVSGAIKQKVGEAFNDQKLANSGVAEQVKGAAKETWGKAKDVANDRKEAASDEAGLHAERKSDNVRDRIVDTAQNIKQNINQKLDDIRDKS
jgi:uncharacterized protein YjbJ (UPF0337 family)